MIINFSCQSAFKSTAIAGYTSTSEYSSSITQFLLILINLGVVIRTPGDPEPTWAEFCFVWAFHIYSYNIHK